MGLSDSGEQSREAERERAAGTGDGPAAGFDAELSPPDPGVEGTGSNTVSASQTEADTTGVGEASASSRTTNRPQTTYTARFVGFVVLIGVLVAVGLSAVDPVALGAAGLLLVFLIAGLLQTPSVPAEHLSATYEVAPDRPRPGESIAVTVTVENTGTRTLMDVRAVDTVPDGLRVLAGNPRAGGPLRPGESLTIEYEVRARRGRYAFGTVVGRTRTLFGSMWAQQPIPAAAGAEVRCAVTAEDIPLENRGTGFVGQLLSESGGEGVEFHTTREYHHGDPPSRINWRELAKRGDLSTITYRERQAAHVTVIADARQPARTQAAPGEPSGVELGLYATYQIAAALTDQDHYVGLSVPGLPPGERDGPTPTSYARFEHSRSEDVQRHVLDLLDGLEGRRAGPQTQPGSALSGHQPITTDGQRTEAIPFDASSGTSLRTIVRELRGFSAPETQFICVSPLLDAGIVGLCRRLRAAGFPVIVISPDVTRRPRESPVERTHRSPAGTGAAIPNRIRRVQRAARLESFRRRGMTVIDWDPSTPLAEAVANQTHPGD